MPKNNCWEAEIWIRSLDSTAVGKKAVENFRSGRELSSSFNENNYQNSYTINEVDDCIFIGFDTFLRR